MKAVLVIDMPKNCAECRIRFSGEPNEWCWYLRHGLDDIKAKPSWCPLKPMPKELVYEGYESPNKQIGEAILRSEWGKKAKKNDAICIRSFSIGYNACLEEIEE